MNKLCWLIFCVMFLRCQADLKGNSNQARPKKNKYPLALNWKLKWLKTTLTVWKYTRETGQTAVSENVLKRCALLWDRSKERTKFKLSQYLLIAEWCLKFKNREVLKRVTMGQEKIAAGDLDFKRFVLFFSIRSYAFMHKK